MMSIVVDFGILALSWFSALAFGANELWAMGVISIAALALLMARVWAGQSNGQSRFQSNWHYIAIILFLALAGIQVLFWRKELPAFDGWIPHTIERHTTLTYFVLAASYAAIIAIIHMGFRSRTALRRLMVGVLGLGIFEAVYGIIQYVGDYNYIWSFQKKAYLGLATGTLINRNHYALLLNIIICLGVGFVFYRSQRLLGGKELSIRNFLAAPGSAKLGWIVALLSLMGLAVVFSMSRMGIVAMLCSVGVMIIAANMAEAGRRGVRIGILLLLAILGSAIYIGVDPILERYERISLELQSERDRIALWRDVWKMVEKHPVFGQGLGTFQWTFPSYETVDPDLPARYAHNDYLQLAAETGMIGLGLMIWIFVLVWSAAVKNLRNGRDPLVSGIGLGTIGALTAVALQEITDFGLYIPGVAIIAAVIVGLNLRARAMALKN